MTFFNFTQKYMYNTEKIIPKSKERNDHSESMRIIRMKEGFLLYSNSLISAYVTIYVITE